MRYVAVHLYADVEHRDFRKFRLSRDAPSYPTNEDEVIAPSPKKKSKYIGWMLDNDYSEGDGKDGEDCNAAWGRVADKGDDKDGKDGHGGDDSNDSYDDSNNDFDTPKRRNKKLAKPKQCNKNWPNVACTKKGKQQSTLI